MSGESAAAINNKALLVTSSFAGVSERCRAVGRETAGNSDRFLSDWRG
jgi:hypothetical protein